MSQQLAVSKQEATEHPIETDIPARLDRLPWSRFHWLLIMALGVTWILDGLEATVVAAISPVLTKRTTLNLSAGEMGLAGTLYLAGAITGALVFGHLTDRLGRKRLFTVTLLIYLCGATLTAFSWNLVSFVLFRCLTGMAIGGEYSAINSAIDELIPARVRGRVDLAINGSYWVGAMIGAGASVILLDPRLLPEWLGWRISFGLGGAIGVAMIIARQFVPESPRWLLTHGREDEAEDITKQIEHDALSGSAKNVPETSSSSGLPRITLYPGEDITFGMIVRMLFVRYRRRAILGLVLIASQAFFYNGISFTFPLVLNRVFGVAEDRTGLYVLTMAVANFLGPLVLGHWFDTVGRRKMIAGTYSLSGIVLVGTEFLFWGGHLNAQTQTLLWGITFFFASAAASAGYLTISEIFPVEMRALAIAFFYAVGTAIGGLVAPALFGALLDTGRNSALVAGYLFGAALMLAAAIVEWALGLDAEQKGLEEIAEPLSAQRRSSESRQQPS